MLRASRLRAIPESLCSKNVLAFLYGDRSRRRLQSLSPFLHSPVASELSDDPLQRTRLGSAKSKQLARLHWSRFPLLTEVIFLHAVIPSEARNLSSIVAGFDLGCPVQVEGAHAAGVGPLQLPLDSSVCVDDLVGENKFTARCKSR
jgi:hypothetical protein